MLCSKSFPTPGDLKSHMYVHTGTWPFKCDVCQRGFSKQTNLKNHMQLHMTGQARHSTEGLTNPRLEDYLLNMTTMMTNNNTNVKLEDVKTEQGQPSQDDDMVTRGSSEMYKLFRPINF